MSSITKRIVVNVGGLACHLDVTVDFQAVAEELVEKAVKNKNHKSKEVGGAVTVEYIP